MNDTHIYTIGNSDDKLTQSQWSEYVRRVDNLLREYAEEVYGVFFSLPDSPWQNACWSVKIDESDHETVWRKLETIKNNFSQESIALVEGQTYFIK